MEKMTIEQFGQSIKKKYPAYASFSDAEIGQKMLAKYPQYQDKVNGTPAPVVTDKRTPAEKIDQYNKEQITYDANAKKANSLGTILGRTAKGTGEIIAAPEVALGKTIGKIVTGPQSKEEANLAKQVSDRNLALIKIITEKRKNGQDPTADIKEYKSNLAIISKNSADLDEYNKNLPSTVEALGQIGGTTLDLLTAGTYGKTTAPMTTGKLFKPATTVMEKATTIIPEIKKVGEIANKKATGIFTKEGAKKVATGGGIGYASDVTEGLQGNRGEDRKGADAFIPGFGTAFGTALPAITEVTQSFKNKFGAEGKAKKIISGRKEELAKLDNYGSVEKVSQKAKDKGFDVKDFVANSDLLHKSVDKTGTISTKGEGQAIQQVQDFINKNGEDVVNKILEKEGKSIDIPTLKARLEKAVIDSNLQGANLTKAMKEIESDLAGYAMRADKDGRIPLAIVHNAKVDKYSNINFMTDPSVQKTAKVIAKTLKEIVEKNTDSADIRAINSELSRYYTVLDYLEKLDGKKVEGGKLGKYFASTVGAMIGSHFGPLGTVGGAMAGEALKSNKFQKTFGGKTGATMKSSEMMKEAIKESNKPRLMLPAPKKGAPRSVIGSGKTIHVAPKGGRIEMLGKTGYTP